MRERLWQARMGLCSHTLFRVGWDLRCPLQSTCVHAAQLPWVVFTGSSIWVRCPSCSVSKGLLILPLTGHPAFSDPLVTLSVALHCLPACMHACMHVNACACCCVLVWLHLCAAGVVFTSTAPTQLAARRFIAGREHALCGFACSGPAGLSTPASVAAVAPWSIRDL